MQSPASGTSFHLIQSVSFFFKNTKVMSTCMLRKLTHDSLELKMVDNFDSLGPREQIKMGNVLEK